MPALIFEAREPWSEKQTTAEKDYEHTLAIKQGL